MFVRALSVCVVGESCVCKQVFAVCKGPRLGIHRVVNDDICNLYITFWVVVNTLLCTVTVRQYDNPKRQILS